MNKSVKEKVYDFILPIVENLGYELVDVEYVKKINGMNLTIFIDQNNGITLEDCEVVHKAIDLPLDELNPTNDAPYTLNVSSCGLDRPFTTSKDFDRNIGKEVEVNLYSKLNGKKQYVGKLTSHDDLKIVIEIDSRELVIEKNKISKITKYISF